MPETAKTAKTDRTGATGRAGGRAVGEPRRAGTAGRGAGPARRKRSKAWLPRQHGAWAMLVVPVLVGLFRSGPDPIHVPLIGFWFAAYFTYNALGVWFSSRRKRVNLPPLLVYGSLAAVLGLVTVWLRPDLLRLVPPFVPLVLIALWSTASRRERLLLNDVATIAAACLFGYVTYLAGYEPEGTIAMGRMRMMGATVAMGAYFVGTALYVKTIIRERTSVAYKRASVAYHAVWTVVWLAGAAYILATPPPAHVLGMPLRVTVALALFFVVLTVRAGVLAGRRIKPMHVGLGEIAASTVLTAILVVLW